MDLDILCHVEDGSQIIMHTFGYGSDHDAGHLSSYTERHLLLCRERFTAFGGALGGVLSVVAQNAVLHIDVPPESMATGVELVNVHHKNKIAREDGSVTVVSVTSTPKRAATFSLK